MQKYIPSKDWNFEREIQSRILMELDLISCQISNMVKKKGVKPRKPQEQFQPDYVKKAKDEARHGKKESNKLAQDDLAMFFEEHNSKVKELGDK